MKIINNHIVCSGCEEPFEVGQKFWGFIKPQNPALITGLMFQPENLPSTSKEEVIRTEEIFHEGCD